jgi:hypothetical protein
MARHGMVRYEHERRKFMAADAYSCGFGLCWLMGGFARYDGRGL